MEGLTSGLKAAKISSEAQAALGKCKNEDEKQHVETEMNKSMLPLMVRLHFLNLTVDVTHTLHTVVEKVRNR